MRRRGAIARFTGRASIDGQRICTADFMCARNSAACQRSPANAHARLWLTAYSEPSISPRPVIAREADARAKSSFRSQGLPHAAI